MAAAKSNCIARLRPEERGFGAAIHFPLSIVPLWSFVFLLGAWVFYKERSREMVFQIQQALFYAAAQHVGILCWILFEVLLRPVSFISPGVAEFGSQANTSIVAIFLGLHAAGALAAAIILLLGRPLLYPLIGRRVMEGALSRLDQES